MSLTCTVSNIQFDFAFNKAVETAKKSVVDDKTTSFTNGIPNQTVLIFKTVCCLPDEELNTKVISQWYFKLSGVAISGTSTVRNMTRLAKYGLLEITDNPFGKSHKYR